MGREIRRVPAKWNHPRHWWTGREGFVVGEYRGMYQQDYSEAIKDYEKDLADWMAGYKLWQEGKYKGYKKDEVAIGLTLKDTISRIKKEQGEYKSTSFREKDIQVYTFMWGDVTYEDYAGEPPNYPNPYDYMPFGEWYQLFETVSEGTPLTPPFKTKKQLVEWLATHEDYWQHQWTREQAEAMVRDEYAPSMVMQDGKLYTAEESVLL